MPDSRRPRRPKPNLLRKNGIGSVDWKNPDLLRLFISDRGKIRSRRVTGLSPQEQHEVSIAIKNAREMALIPYPSATRR